MKIISKRQFEINQLCKKFKDFQSYNAHNFMYDLSKYYPNIQDFHCMDKYGICDWRSMTILQIILAGGETKIHTVL